jgi:hypothetical protein
MNFRLPNFASAAGSKFQNRAGATGAQFHKGNNGHLQPCFTGHAAGSGIGYGCIVFQGEGFLSENSDDIDMLPLTAL